MTNDRLYLKCNVCGESKLFVKYIPVQSHLWKPDDLMDWMNLHFAACHNAPMFLDDDARFEMITEEAYVLEESKCSMLAAAREKWPEIDEPNIVNASPGRHTLVVPIAPFELKAMFLSGDELLFTRDAGGQLVPLQELPIFGEEHIELEPVGRFMLGYGPKSHILYVGDSPV